MNIIFLQFQPPGLSWQFLGFVLVDREARRAYTRCRSSWEASIDPSDAEVASSTPEVIQNLFAAFDFETAVRKVSEMSITIRAADEMHIPTSRHPEALADGLADLLLH